MKVTVNLKQEHVNYLLSFAEITKTTTPGATLGELLDQMMKAYPLPEHKINMWEKIRPGLVTLAKEGTEPPPRKERKEPEPEEEEIIL